MNEELIQTFDLENNLVLELFDASKKITGDRFQVSLVSRIKIPIRNDLFGKELKSPDIEDIISALGETVIYEEKDERNFVDEKEKAEVLKELCDQVKINALKYYRHPNFAGRFVLKMYQAL